VRARPGTTRLNQGSKLKRMDDSYTGRLGPRIPYRLTSGVALSSFSLAIVTLFLPPPPPKYLPPSVNDEVAWDPCSVWVQIGAMERAALWICFAAFLLFTIRGLRNRPGPRWFAIVGFVALVEGIVDDWWRIAGGCYSRTSLICSFTWFSALGLMFLHHSIQRKHSSDPVSRRAGFWGKVQGGILPVFVSLPVACTALDQVRFRAYHRNHPTIAYTALTNATRWLGWTEIVLLPVVAALGLYWLSARTPKARGS